MKRISVIVPTYNSCFADIIKTVESIIIQQNISYEIIICDDGSKENNENKIKEYFQEKNVRDYILIFNQYNKGTVKNLISALQVAKGKYVKIIAPGDMLCNRDTLNNITSFLERNHSNFGFGRMLGYRKNENLNVEYKDYKVPKDLRPYMKEDIKKISKNIILYMDFISGASMFAEKNSLLEELINIADIVRYCEDFIQINLILKGTPFKFYDENIVLYECTQGISNQKSGLLKVNTDYENYIQLLHKKYNANLLKKRFKLNRYNKIRNPILRILKKILCAPGLYVFNVRHFSK